MAGAERKEIIDVPLKAFFQAVTDFEKYPQFVSGVKSTRVVSNEGVHKRVEFDLEMMKQIHYVLDVQESFDESKGQAEVSWTLVDSDLLKSNVGGWKLRALDPQKTEVIYHLDLEFNISVPGLILRGLVSKALPTAIREFSEQAKKVARS